MGISCGLMGASLACILRASTGQAGRDRLGALGSRGVALDERHAGEEGVIRSDIADVIDRAAAMAVYAYHAVPTRE